MRCLSLHCNCCKIMKKTITVSWELRTRLKLGGGATTSMTELNLFVMTMAINVAQLWCGPCAFKWCLDWSKAERCLFIVSCVQWVIREGTRPYFSVHKCLEDHRLLAVSFFIISLVFHHHPGLMIITTVSLIDNLISLTFLGSESKMSLFSRQSKLDSGWRGSIEHKVLQKSTTWEDLQKEWS